MWEFRRVEFGLSVTLVKVGLGVTEALISSDLWPRFVVEGGWMEND